jgi:hypothetical protein
MNGPVLIPICSWFLTALSDFFNSLLGHLQSAGAIPLAPATKSGPILAEIADDLLRRSNYSRKVSDFSTGVIPSLSSFSA